MTTTEVEAAQVHYTDLCLALAAQCGPIVQRNEGKTGMYWGPGAQALVNDLIEYLADRRDDFDEFCDIRKAQIDHQPIDAPYVAQSWLETDEGPNRIKSAKVAEIIDECSRIPHERRADALAPIIAWGEATGLDGNKLEVMRSAVANSLPAVEVEVDVSAVKAGDEFDWRDKVPEELVGRRVRAVGFGVKEGTMRVVPIGPWEKDPDVREPIGGAGPTTSFMGTPESKDPS